MLRAQTGPRPLDGQQQRAVRYLGELYSLASALFWAVAVILFRKSGEQLEPVALNLFKGAAALVLLVASMALLGTAPFPAGIGKREWGILLASGIIGIGVADTLFFASLNRLGAGRNSIVACLYSPFVVLCAALMLGEPVGVWLVAGVGLLATGILLDANPFGPTDHRVPRREARAGVLLGAIAMFLMAFGIVLAKPVLETVDVLWASTVRVLGGTAFVALHCLRPRHHAAVRRAFTPSKLWFLLVPGAFVGTYLAMMLWLAGMKYTNASVAGVLNQLSTLLVPLLAAPLLHERLTSHKMGAVALGFAGAVVGTLWGRG
jgi:drug/metabolite transporter (DMT)-like permease